MPGPVGTTLILLLELHLFQRQQQWIGLILVFRIVPLVKKTVNLKRSVEENVWRQLQ